LTELDFGLPPSWTQESSNMRLRMYQHRLFRQPAIAERRTPTRAQAFTLLEVLVVLTIIALLMSILLPALNAARTAAKTLHCSSNMRTISVEFELFASGKSEAGRGGSERLGENRFWINDFQDSLYRLDEFWDLPDDDIGYLSAGEEPAVCPAGASRLTKRRGLPCGREAVGPVEDVSVAVNMRLYRAVVDFRGKTLLAPSASTRVSTRILNHPYVPLAFDVDGRAAGRRGIDPFYIAPGLPGVDDPYIDDRYWVPSKRHGGKTVVAFVGGHVLTSPHPEQERWDWTYQAEVGQ
jgi:prepilin-type N-terminal cleavage/methylation domain-containing protein/prepilin-type processing-associated H-X9-DG protein